MQYELDKILFQEINEESLSVAFKKISSQPVFRITVLVLLNLGVLVRLVHGKIDTSFLPYSFAEEEIISQPNLGDPITPEELQALTKFQSKDKDEDKKEDENKRLMLKLNEIIFSHDEKCLEDKKDSRCTELCVENEEEIIAQMKEEERRAWMKYVSSKPRLSSKNISCAKDTKGARKSDTKGKHMDEDCCPDPDEWPKPGCVYSAKGIALMLKGPVKKK